MYKIGFPNHYATKKEALKLSEKLIGIEQTTQLVELEASDSDGNFELQLNALRNDVVDIVCLNLPLILQGLPDDIVIAALSERSENFEKLVYKIEEGNTNPHIKLNDQAKVAVFSKRAEALAHDLFPQWKVEIIDKNDLKTVMDVFDGVIASSEFFDEVAFDISKYSTFSFHPKEFIPHPGQNVVAFMCLNEDKELRKQLSKIHITEVSQATNIERKIEQELSEEGWSGIGVYCLVDHNYHFHVYASGLSPDSNIFKRTRYSTGTSEHIAKNVLGLLSTND